MLLMRVYNPSTDKWEYIHSDYSANKLDEKADKTLIDKATFKQYEIIVHNNRLAVIQK